MISLNDLLKRQRLLKIFSISFIFLFLINKPVYADLEIKDPKFIITSYVDKIEDLQKLKRIKYKLEKSKSKNELTIFFKEKLDEKEKILKQEYEIEINKLNKILLWYSRWWKEIYWYYKWDIKKPFFWIFANIHWWYEYWTYLTAMSLLKELEKSDKKQWFIIPTINPDWLWIASNNNFSEKYYIEWRENANHIDINRNFCTDDFSNYSYNKKTKNFYSWSKCNSEKESLLINNVLSTYHFSEIISLHSEWWIFFIPDNSYYDNRIIGLAKKIKTILPEYYFEFPTYDKQKDDVQKWIIEININKSPKIYTGLMENYIYQKYNIPTLLIEFKKHWVEENNLLKIIDYL